MSLKQVRKIPLRQLLSHLGYEPVKVDHERRRLWYFSPLHSGGELSFWVDTASNSWGDVGGLGGDPVDLVMLYRGCDREKSLRFLEAQFGRQGGGALLDWLGRFFSKGEKKEPENQPLYLELDWVQPLEQEHLLCYLRHRGVDPDIARLYLQEAFFHNPRTREYSLALAFRNDNGGYELRNSGIRSTVGPPGLTFLRAGKAERVSVFESFMDFLSNLTDRESARLDGHALILNSLSQQTAGVHLLAGRSYERIYTFFDNDTAGKKAAARFIRHFGETVCPCNRIYAGYKDYNEYLASRS